MRAWSGMVGAWAVLAACRPACGEGTALVDGQCVVAGEFSCLDACARQVEECGTVAAEDLTECTEYCLALDPADRNLDCFRDATCAELEIAACAVSDDGGGGEAADHSRRCASFCSPQPSDETGTDQCLDEVEDQCVTLCEELLDGFDAACGSCFLGYGTEPYATGWEGETCSYHDFSGLDLCDEECVGNERELNAAQAEAICDAFCAQVPNEDHERYCDGEDRRACRDDCTAEILGLTRRCGVCVVSRSDPPRSYSDSCEPHDLSSVSLCSDMCE